MKNEYLLRLISEQKKNNDLKHEILIRILWVRLNNKRLSRLYKVCNACVETIRIQNTKDLKIIIHFLYSFSIWWYYYYCSNCTNLFIYFKFTILIFTLYIYIYLLLLIIIFYRLYITIVEQKPSNVGVQGTTLEDLIQWIMKNHIKYCII